MKKDSGCSVSSIAAVIVCCLEGEHVGRPSPPFPYSENPHVEGDVEVGAPAGDVSNQLALLDSRTRPLIYFHVLSLLNDVVHSGEDHMTALNSSESDGSMFG